MMQNRLIFNQSSVSLEIIGLPDYSNNENNDQISIISQWKLVIIDKPLIEGKIEHLEPIMEAFYIYSKLLINDEIPSYESEMIDIHADNLHIHSLLLKSSKPETKPLNMKMGNSLLSDIISCFDQLNESSKVRIKNSVFFNSTPKKIKFGLENKDKLINFFLPPFISICSLILFSSTIIYFYNPIENKEKKELINSKSILNSAISRNTIV